MGTKLQLAFTRRGSISAVWQEQGSSRSSIMGSVCLVADLESRAKV